MTSVLPIDFSHSAMGLAEAGFSFFLARASRAVPDVSALSGRRLEHVRAMAGGAHVGCRDVPPSYERYR